MSGPISYSIRKNRYKQGLLNGFRINENGNLASETDADVHFVYLRGINGIERDAKWGRLRYDAEFDENTTCLIYIFAINEDSFYYEGELVRIDDFMVNPDIDKIRKRRFFEKAGFRRFANQKDILLYDLSGQYLYICIALIGNSDFEISNMRVEQLGDNFMNTFPEIYRERNSFFHRYMSIFSTIYNDFQMNIDDIYKLLDLDKCPETLLLTYGRWLGLELDEEYAGEPWLRPLVKEAHSLNRMRGTRYAIARITEIMTGEKVIVLENNIVRKNIEVQDMDMFRKLYGDSIYDVAIIIKPVISEELRCRLTHIMNQFKPARTQINIICLGSLGAMDMYSYFDVNARIEEHESGFTDDTEACFDGFYVLE